MSVRYKYITTLHSFIRCLMHSIPKPIARKQRSFQQYVLVSLPFFVQRGCLNQPKLKVPCSCFSKSRVRFINSIVAQCYITEYQLFKFGFPCWRSIVFFGQNLESKLASCRDFVCDTSVSRPALPAGSPPGLERGPEIQGTSMSPPPQYDRWEEIIKQFTIFLTSNLNWVVVFHCIFYFFFLAV